MQNSRTSPSLLGARAKVVLVLLLFSCQFAAAVRGGNPVKTQDLKNKVPAPKAAIPKAAIPKAAVPKAALPLVPFVPLVPLSPGAATISVWKLTQEGDFMGDRILYICKDGYKAEYTKANYVVLLAQPKWDVVFYNKTRKTIFTNTIEKSKQNFGLRSRIAKESFFPDNYKMVPGKGEVVAGHKTDCIMCIGQKSKEHYGKTDVVRSAYYMSNEIPMAPQVTDYFGQTWSNELCRRQSLRILVWTGAGVKKTKIETVKMEKVTVPGDFFKAPTGYTKVKSEDNVMLGNDLINDIVDDLGKQFGSNK
ncbi:MAG: hypothetical protein JNN26_26150 [Candidatus Obscuribacter sp.]|nr:hypothetical protein [Candidatus Obscuribacter sp.]